MRLRPALLALLVLVGSCSRRERSNPLDPENPNTGGAPEGFNAIADAASVRLRWNARPDLPIDGFRLLRLAPGDSLYRPLGPLLPNFISSEEDGTTDAGLEYRYRLHYVIGGALAARFAEDAAMPGPLRPWVVDADGGRVLRLSPDGRDVLQARSGFGSSSSLAVTPEFGPLWVADELAGVVDIVNVGDFTGPRVRGVSDPFSIALDPFDGSGWICDLAQPGSVRHYQSNGATASPATLPLLDDPEGVATSAADGAVWVTELAGGRVRRYWPDGLPQGARPLLSPSRVAVDSATGEAWVTSVFSGWVWRVDSTLTVLDSLRLQGPLGLALDWRRRTAWVADPVGDELVAIDMDTRAVRFRVAGLGAPRDVAVDLARGDAWAVSRPTSSVYRVSPAGAIVGAVGGLGDPAEVRLDPGFVGPRVGRPRLGLSK